ncbi:MAG: pyridoxamine 5'-phosphate oxidase family protein, partial [Proteobacteria bacterium]|nr:pyridoxamine 5'-phosphate oxidase family protein [Pseudomonadota bacterium]
MTETYPIDETNRLRRTHQRGAHDHATVHALLDAGMLAHIAYVIDGQPYCTPTLYWREGNHLYWHGSSASRMLRQQIKGVPVCLTVTQMDSLVLARSAFHHSVDFRAVMAFGRARLVSDPAAKERALAMMVDRLFPGRTAGLRPMNPQELKATAVVVMEIERASAKVRAAGVVDDEEDYALPIWAERIPLRTVLGASEPCPRLVPGTARPAGLG